MTDLGKLAALAEAATPGVDLGAAGEVEAIRSDLAKYPTRYDGKREGPYDPVVYARRLLARYDAAVRERDELREIVELAREFSEADRAYLDAPMDDDEEALYHLRDARERLRAALHSKDGAS